MLRCETRQVTLKMKADPLAGLMKLTARLWIASALKGRYVNLLDCETLPV